MNPQIKEKWVAALRSGEYQQAVGQLKSEHGFCCLGVLCDLFDPARWEHTSETLAYRGRFFISPPIDVFEWAGLQEADGRMLITLNDGATAIGKRSFPQIADYIEANL